MTLFLLIIILSFFSVPKEVLFYDAPEYIKIVSENSFLRSIGMGHFPIHPSFIADLWISAKVFTSIFKITYSYAGNLYAYFCGLLSIFLFWKISNLYLKKKDSYIATLIFVFFPAIWIINTNLLVESLGLTLFLLSSYLYSLYLNEPAKEKLIYLFLSLLFLFTTHIESILWLPAMVSIPLLMRKKFTPDKNKNIFTIVILSIITSFLVYYILCQGNPLKGQSLTDSFYLSQLDDVASLARYLRNIFMSVLRGYGILTFIVYIIIVLKNKENRLVNRGTVLFIVSLLITGGFWSGDFMIRRIVFAGIIFSLLTVKYLPQFSKMYLAYLFLIAISNIALYINRTTPWRLMSNMHQAINKNSILIQTHYVRPFETFSGEIKWIGQDSLLSIDKYLHEEKEVYLDSQGFYAPYMLYVGNNLHITSLGKFGESEARALFSNYEFNLEQVSDVDKRMYLYKINKKRGDDFVKRLEINKKVLDEDLSLIVGITDPGKSVLFYSKDPLKFIHRERIDYGDFLTWVWVLLAGRREPIGWAYGDSSGLFVYIVKTNDLEKIYFDKRNIRELTIINGIDQRAYIPGNNWD